ncbi:MAG: 50S ribosomal protein L30 [Anaerolineae bacterium]|nr:MAG: 50S ribosomal protein L30 [Anaerolineae bacterium]
MTDKKTAAQKKLRITLIKSPIGYNQRQKGTIRALGLRRMGHTVEQLDTPVVRGMVQKVSHLVQVEEFEG